MKGGGLMNNTYFIGRLVTDPELKELENAWMNYKRN